MSLHPQSIPPVPEITAQIAQAAFRNGNLYLTMRQELGTLFTDEDFAAVYPRRGRPAWTPWRLALITLMQFVENLSDRQAADAVRARIDWKYALSLELDDAGFDFSLLCEFRERLVEGNICFWIECSNFSRRRSCSKPEADNVRTAPMS
jgi:transposase